MYRLLLDLSKRTVGYRNRWHFILQVETGVMACDPPSANAKLPVSYFAREIRGDTSPRFSNED